MIGERCTECAKKHLRAALAYASERSDAPTDLGRADVAVCVNSPTAFTSEAWVLLSESGSYPEHVALAIGFVVRAEEEAFAGGIWETVGANIRKIRLASEDPVTLMCNLETAGLVDPMVGHMREAAREGGIEIPMILNARIVIDNFDGLTKAAETPTPEERKEGEVKMAKSKKCADKGGCAKKCADKGGKTKKGCCGKKGCK